MILNVKNLTHGFGDRAIFDNVSFRLLKGEHIGLIGANGEGKSTFMNIITGKLTPDEGTVEWAKNVRVGYLDQHSVLEKGMTIGDVLRSAFQFLFAMEAEMNRMYEQMGDATPEEMERLLAETGTYQELLEQHDFYMIDTKVDEIARALGLEELGLDRDVTDLSGGQRTRVLMATLLLEKPDILLLDEPTNYLDEQHIEWLKRYLQDYENAFILISHDIPFLNSVINLIYHMENCRLDRYPGDYDKFQEVYAMKKAQLEAAYNRQQQEISDLKDFVARNKARVATRNMAMARQKKLDKMDIIELDREKPKPEFHFKTARTSGKMIFETNDLVIGYDEPLTKPLNIRMERGERIALTGANGIGKTTLLKSILQLIKPYSGEVHLGDYQHIGYFEQESDTQNTSTCIEEIWSEFPAMTQYEIRSMLAKCGLTTKHIESQVRVLSGGEQAKVRLCKILNRESNILLLDEPTNHLDVDAKAELKKALQEYKGSILLICHEPEFYQDIVTDELNVKEIELTDDVRAFTSYTFKPQLKTVGPKYGKLLGGIKNELSNLDGNAAMDELNATGVLKLQVNGQEIELTKEDLLIDMAQMEGYVSESDYGITVVLDTNLTEELLTEGFVREIISKIQTMRKEAGFEVMDKIKVTYDGSEKAEKVFAEYAEQIGQETLAVAVEKAEPAGYVKDWKINGEAVNMGVEKQGE